MWAWIGSWQWKGPRQPGRSSLLGAAFGGVPIVSSSGSRHRQPGSSPNHSRPRLAQSGDHHPPPWVEAPPQGTQSAERHCRAWWALGHSRGEGGGGELGWLLALVATLCVSSRAPRGSGTVRAASPRLWRCVVLVVQRWEVDAESGRWRCRKYSALSRIERRGPVPSRLFAVVMGGFGSLPTSNCSSSWHCTGRSTCGRPRSGSTAAISRPRGLAFGRRSTPDGGEACGRAVGLGVVVFPVLDG